MVSASRSSSVEDAKFRSLRNWIFFYAFLWIFEGALRKWFLPGLSNPLLLVRDPVVLVIYLMAYSRGIFPLNGFVLVAAALTFFGFGMTMALGHGDLVVAIYGARAMLLHLPLIFIIPRVMDLGHVQKLARTTLWITIPMTVLLVLQFMSPVTAWVNRGLGGKGTAGFEGALGRFRPPGTWSFITGPAAFYPFATASWFLYVLHRRRVGLTAFAAGGAILLACPVSISRSMMIYCFIVAAVGMVALFRGGIRSGKLAVQICIAAFVALTALSFTTFFKQGSEAFAARWANSVTNNGGAQEALGGRFLQGLLQPMAIGFDAPIFGYGLGSGTNAGAKLLIGRATFLAGEDEFCRLVMENGLVLGWAWILFRIILAGSLFAKAWQAWKKGNSYPIIIFSAVGMAVLQGQWAQPTTLGFACFGAGLVLAACRPDPSAPLANSPSRSSKAGSTPPAAVTF